MQNTPRSFLGAKNRIAVVGDTPHRRRRRPGGKIFPEFPKCENWESFFANIFYERVVREYERVMLYERSSTGTFSGTYKKAYNFVTNTLVNMLRENNYPQYEKYFLLYQIKPYLWYLITRKS